jgi:hypothetical protein
MTAGGKTGLDRQNREWPMSPIRQSRPTATSWYPPIAIVTLTKSGEI